MTENFTEKNCRFRFLEKDHTKDEDYFLSLRTFLARVTFTDTIRQEIVVLLLDVFMTRILAESKLSIMNFLRFTYSEKVMPMSILTT